MYSQSCDANAGGDMNIILPHDGSAGGEITFDGSLTSGDNLGDFEWNIYHLPEDTLAYTVTGQTPTISINCYSTQNPDNSWTDCLADYRVVLSVDCDDGQTDNDTINLSVTEENDPPVACLTTQSDSYLTNEALLVPNNNGIPGEETNVLLYSYIEILNCPQPDADFANTFVWFDQDGNIISPVQSLGEGAYTFTFRRVDSYETYSELLLNIELDEQNTIPTISIAAINEIDIGLNQTVVDGETINLFGTIVDTYNDVDDIDGDGTQDDIVYNWNYTVVPNEALIINNPNTLNPTVTAPSIGSNSESSEITITLEAQDPFQIIDNESSISDPIVITVVNDNVAPLITNTISGYEIIEDGFSDIDYDEIDDFIDVTDADENIFTVVIKQEDIDSDPVTYANYSLSGGTTITPDNDFYGQITVPIRLNDGYTVNGNCYNCESELANLVIDVVGVNDAPVLTVPASLSVDEDTDLTITEISVQDVDSESTGPNNFNLEFEITVEKGTLSLSSNTGSINYSSGDGVMDDEMIFTSSVTDFNNALSGAIFHPEDNYYGPDGQITISVNDLGNNGIQDSGDPVQLTDNKNINININDINDPPIITSGDSYNVDENQTDFYITDINLDDGDVENLQLILELTVSNGVLELSETDDITCLEGGNCYSTASNMQFRGTLDVLNNSISNLHYVPDQNFNGLDVLVIRLNDMGNVGDEELEDIKNININVEAVNSPPYISSDAFYNAFEDSLFTIENISLEDVDVDEGDGVLQLAIDCPDCKVSLDLPIQGIDFGCGECEGNGFENNLMVFRGGLSDINDAIENLDIISNQNFCGQTTMQITANDLGNYSSSGIEESHVVNIGIQFTERNDPPVNEDPITSQIVLPIVSFSEDALSLNTTTGLWNDLIDEECAPQPSGITYEYQWQRADDTTDVIVDIVGEISSTYFIGTDDADKYLRSRIIATDDGFGYLNIDQADTAYSSFVKMDNLAPFITDNYEQQIGYEDSLLVFQLSGYVEDPDGNDLTFSIDQDIDADKGALSLNQNTGEIQFTPSANINFNSIPGFVEFSYRVSDFQYTSAEAGTIIMRIRARNDAPTFSTSNVNPNISVQENAGYVTEFDWATAIDDGDAEVNQVLDFVIQSVSNEDLFNKDAMGNCIIQIDDATGDLSFELAEDANGSADVTIALQDNGGIDNWSEDISEFDTSESFVFTIDVEAVNNPPTFDKGDDITIDEDDGTVNFPWATNMDDGDPELDQLYQFVTEVLNEADTMFTDLPIIDADTGLLSFTAAENMNGEIFVKVELDDNGSNNPAPNYDISEPETLRIFINPINDAPTFSIDADDLIIGDQTIIYEDSGPQNIQDFAKEINDGDPLLNGSDIQELEFVLTDLSNPNLFSVPPAIDDNGTLTFTPAENQNGESTVTFVLTDLFGTPNNGVDESLPITFTIEIFPLNDAPFFNLRHAGVIINSGELIRFEDFSEPNTISVLPERYNTPADEESPNQSVIFSIEPDVAINANGKEFVNVGIVPTSGEMTFTMIPNGNGQATFTVKATDNGPGVETGIGDVNVHAETFTVIVNPLGDHPEVDLNDPPALIEPVELRVDSLISIYHGTWIDTTDTNMSGTSEIIGYEYLWQAADDIDSEGLYDIGTFDPDSIDYVITQNEAHKYIRSIVRAIDNGWGDVSLSTLDEDDRFTDTTDWVQVLNTKPVVVDDLTYFTWEDVPLTIDIIDGLISDDVSDTTTDYDKDLDSIWINSYDLSTAWGQIDINPDGSFYFDPSPLDPDNPNPDQNFHALSDTFGIVNFTYELIDEYGATSNSLGQVQIEIGSLNDAPEFTIQDQNNGLGNIIDTIEVLEDFEEIKLGFSIPGHLPLDEAPPNQIVQYSINPQAVNFADLILDSDNGSIQISAKEDWNGEQLFTVTAVDDGPGEETGNGDDNDYEQTFYLKVVPVNDVPIFEMLPDTIVVLEDREADGLRGLFDTLNWIVSSDVGAILEEDQVLSYNISYVNDQDVNGDTWTFTNSPEIINDYDLTFQVSDDHNGLSEVAISIQDDGGTMVDYLDNPNYEVGVDESEPQTFFIRVLPVNDVPTFVYGANDTLDEDSGLITYQNWITGISAGPSNESFQHDSLEFNIIAYDKFNNELQGLNSDAPNNILFKSPPSLLIDSIDTTKAHLSFELNNNHNGLSYLRFNLNDKGGTDYSGIEQSSTIEKELYVRQVSDKSKDFVVHAKTHEYAIDSTTFFLDTTMVEYFRLPYQDFAPDIQIPEKMRFAWEKNDSLDVDTYATTNLDTLFETYYRLEMTTDSSDYTYVLFDFIKGSQDLLPSYRDNLFSNDTSYFVDIDMNSLFPAYLDTFVFDASWEADDTLLPRYDTLMYIDTTGFTNYKWNVVAQNYSRDIYNHDISNKTISNRDLVVDLEVPIAKYSFVENDLYNEYYELYFKTSEETIENVASIWIDFPDSSIYRIPHKIDDYYFHLSSTFFETGIVNYNFQVRDLVENIGKSTKTIAFQFLQDDLAKTIYSPDDLFAIHSSPNSVLDKTGIALFSEDYNSNIVNNNIQMSSEYHVFPYQKAFNQPITLEFSNISFDDDLWKYQIKNKQNEEWIEIESSIKDGKIFADAMFGGIYSVFYNPEAKNPVPEKFELVNLYPNPFNPTLTIQYNLDSKQNVSIDIYNILGQKVNRLLNQEVSIGYHSINWNGTNDSGIALGSGIYFVKISTNDESYIRKVTLLK